MSVTEAHAGAEIGKDVEKAVTENNESGVKGITSDSALPLPSVRVSLVDTAVKFLTIPKVISQPEHQKVSFLEKKGLTKDEINEALRQAQVMNMSVQQYTPQNQIVPVPTMLPPALPQRNVWSKFRDSANFFVFLAGMAFGLHYLYKYYLGPFLTGKRQKSSEDALLEVQQSVMVVLQNIQSTLERMDRNILDHNKILLDLKSSEELLSGSDLSSLQDIKTELNTIKGLLINRKTFPSPPLSSIPSIPQWQKRFPQAKDETGTEIKHNEESSQLLNGDVDEKSEENVDAEASVDIIQPGLEV